MIVFVPFTIIKLAKWLIRLLLLVQNLKMQGSIQLKILNNSIGSFGEQNRDPLVLCKMPAKQS